MCIIEFKLKFLLTGGVSIHLDNTLCIAAYFPVIEGTNPHRHLHRRHLFFFLTIHFFEVFFQTPLCNQKERNTLMSTFLLRKSILSNRRSVYHPPPCNPFSAPPIILQTRVRQPYECSQPKINKCTNFRFRVFKQL